MKVTKLLAVGVGLVGVFCLFFQNSGEKEWGNRMSSNNNLVLHS